MVDFGFVQWFLQWLGYDIFVFGLVYVVYVLIDLDVVVVYEVGVGDGQDFGDCLVVVVCCCCGGVVGSVVQQDWCVVCVFVKDDDGEQLSFVVYWYYGFVLDEIGLWVNLVISIDFVVLDWVGGYCCGCCGFIVCSKKW